VKTDSGGSEQEPGKKLGSGQSKTRTCSVCGTKLFATNDSEFCPVCILQGAFGAESVAAPEVSSVAESATTSSHADGAGQFGRFENYEVILDEAGKPMELGRGAMGVTDKALDECPCRNNSLSTVIARRILREEMARSPRSQPKYSTHFSCPRRLALWEWSRRVDIVMGISHVWDLGPSQHTRADTLFGLLRMPRRP
jgi:uncharacterized Zn finger protein (UPF0148 family)